jgi:hypothetical protein
MKEYAVYRFVRDNRPDLVEGLHNPYACIRNDLKRPPSWKKKPHEVTAEVAAEALEALVEQYDVIYKTVWEQLNRLAKMEDKDLKTDAMLKFMELAQGLATQKARVLGVNPEGPSVSGDDERPAWQQNNLFVGGPQGWLQHVQQATEAMKYLPKDTKAADDSNTFDGTATEVGVANSNGDEVH